MKENSEKSDGIVIGIDATNLRGGGGLTHLIEVLSAAEPESSGIAKIIIWGGSETLNKLPDQKWLSKICPPSLNKGLLQRSYWQRYSLSRTATQAGCDILFAPGGNFAGSFRPVVTMSRNLLPFDWKEIRRYGWSLFALKLLALRWLQSTSYKRCNGVIFLTRYAQDVVLSVTGKINGETKIIPHGINDRFKMLPRQQNEITAFCRERPFRLLYVSTVDVYKHQWNVVDAVHQLRHLYKWPLTLDLVGPASAVALPRLNRALAEFDSGKEWARFHGAVAYTELHKMYATSDMAVFASSCENMPNILLEAMSAGLPIACSSMGPMPEILGQAGAYFNPEDPKSIAEAIHALITDAQKRNDKSAESYSRSSEFTWKRCASETLEFLISINDSSQAL